MPHYLLWVGRPAIIQRNQDDCSQILMRSLTIQLHRPAIRSAAEAQKQ